MDKHLIVVYNRGEYNRNNSLSSIKNVKICSNKGVECNRA